MSTFGELKAKSIIWCRERDLVNECIVLSIKKVNETYYDTTYSQIIIELKVENSYRNNGEECTVERQKSVFKEVNSQQCSSGYDRYTIYECK